MRTPDNTLQKGMIVLKKQLDKIDIKLDLLRDEVLKKVDDSMMTERKRYEDLLVAHARIQSELERLKAAADAGEKRQDSEAGSSDEEEDEGELKKPLMGSKVYKVPKVS